MKFYSLFFYLFNKEQKNAKKWNREWTATWLAVANSLHLFAVQLGRTLDNVIIIYSCCFSSLFLLKICFYSWISRQLTSSDDSTYVCSTYYCTMKIKRNSLLMIQRD